MCRVLYEVRGGHDLRKKLVRRRPEVGRLKWAD